MYSNVAASEHEHNWICPQCQRENDKARFLCIHDQCDYINLPPEDGTKTIEYRAIPIQVQRELLICGFTKEIILIANVPNDIISLIHQYFPLTFGWDETRHGLNVTLTATDTVTYERQSEHSPNPAIAVANFSIHSKEYDKFKWQIKLCCTGYPIFMGFIVCPIADHDDSDDYWNPQEFGTLEHKNQIGIYCYPSQRSIYRCPSSQPQHLRGPQPYMMHIPLASTHRSIVNNDIFTFEIDFKSKTCHIYHSNAIFIKNMPSHLIRESNRRDPLNIYPTGPLANKLETNIEIIPAVLVCRGAEYTIKNVTQQLTDQIV